MAKKKKQQDTPMPPAYQERTRYRVSAEEFAITWNSCQSAEEVAEKLGMPKPIVLARVSNYRRNGLKLKKMKRKNSRRLNVGEINNLLEELAKDPERFANVSAQEAIAILRKKLKESGEK
jgi:hypothetical protein